MLLSTAYRETLWDEAHCAKTWENDVRVAFSKIGTLRSFILQHVKVMNLTATCTPKTVELIKEHLSMAEPEVIALSPQRANNPYSVQSPTNLESLSTEF